MTVPSRLELMLKCIVYFYGVNSDGLFCLRANAVVAYLLDNLQLDYTTNLGPSKRTASYCFHLDYDASALPIELMFTSDKSNQRICRNLIALSRGRDLPVRSQHDASIVTDMFKRWGYEVKFITNGKTAAIRFVGNKLQAI